MHDIVTLTSYTSHTDFDTGIRLQPDFTLHRITDERAPH